MKIAKYLLLGLAVLFVGVQVVRPARTNPPATNPFAIGDPDVESVLRRSCFDCHSNETRWPWYSEVAPISWQISDHVEEGREHMNFSAWNEAKALKRLNEICEEVEEGHMPLPSYLLLHGDAKLDEESVKSLCSWSQNLARSMGEAKAPEEAEEDSHGEADDSEEEGDDS